MIDYCLTSGQQWYWWREQDQWYIKTIYRNEGRDGSTESITFDCHLKNMESWIGKKNLVFVASTMRLFFLATLPKTMWAFAILGVRRPLTFHILIFSSETPQPNISKLGWKLPWKVLYKDCSFSSDPCTNMATTDNSCVWVSDWLISKKSSPLKPLCQMNRNLVGSILGRSSIQIAHLVSICVQTWPPQTILVSDWPIF